LSVDHYIEFFKLVQANTVPGAPVPPLATTDDVQPRSATKRPTSAALIVYLAKAVALLRAGFSAGAVLTGSLLSGGPSCLNRAGVKRESAGFVTLHPRGSVTGRVRVSGVKVDA
jgi:hypothetical protein